MAHCKPTDWDYVIHYGTIRHYHNELAERDIEEMTADEGETDYPHRKKNLRPGRAKKMVRTEPWRRIPEGTFIYEAYLPFLTKAEIRRTTLGNGHRDHLSYSEANHIAGRRAAKEDRARWYEDERNREAHRRRFAAQQERANAAREPDTIIPKANVLRVSTMNRKLRG